MKRLGYLDVAYTPTDLTHEELQELIKKQEEEEKNLTDWPELDYS